MILEVLKEMDYKAHLSLREHRTPRLKKAPQNETIGSRVDVKIIAKKCDLTSQGVIGVVKDASLASRLARAIGADSISYKEATETWGGGSPAGIIVRYKLGDLYEEDAKRAEARAKQVEDLV